jgi:uncharacterized protein YndB with AHSA1/START domain
MNGAKKLTVGAVAYELEVEIDAEPARVWRALLEETDAWWLPDFHMVAPGSRVTFEARAGGRLVEESPDGASLLWGTVLWIDPAKRTVLLAGHHAPDWGGPSTSMLKFSVEPRGRGSALKVSDAIFGHVDEKHAASLHEGWTLLFTSGLKAHVEKG